MLFKFYISFGPKKLSDEEKAVANACVLRSDVKLWMSKNGKALLFP